MRTRPCNAAIVRGRMHKANQFMEAADMVRELADENADLADAYVTVCVHAGIAASDVLCCAALGEYAQGENHDEAVGLLARADKDAAKHLRTLLTLKTKAGYSHTPATAGEVKRAGRAAQALAEAARRVARPTRHQ